MAGPVRAGRARALGDRAGTRVRCARVALWLGLAGCAARDSGTAKGAPTGDSASRTDAWLPLSGFVGDVEADAAIAGVQVADVERPEAVAWTAADGTWSFDDARVDFLTLRFTLDGRLPVQAWIAPREASAPSSIYRSRMAEPADLDWLVDAIGITLKPGYALLFLDALDPTMACIEGARVELSAAHDGAWRQDASGVWTSDSHSRRDGIDLVFVNVAPGPATLTVVAPDGTPCELPPRVEVIADELVQVSAYCTYVNTLP